MLLRTIVLAVLLVGCAPTPSPSPSAESGTLEIVAVAGPVCPVETDPPDPDCQPRAVPGARILVQPSDGRDIVVGEATTGDDGTARLELPPGSYVIVALEVDGLMGSPELATATLVAGETVTITLAYDTGIR